MGNSHELFSAAETNTQFTGFIHKRLLSLLIEPDHVAIRPYEEYIHNHNQESPRKDNREVQNRKTLTQIFLCLICFALLLKLHIALMRFLFLNLLSKNKHDISVKLFFHG